MNEPFERIHYKEIGMSQISSLYFKFSKERKTMEAKI